MNFSKSSILKNVALLCPAFVALAVCGTASADTLAGPTFYYASSSWQVTGVGFEANVNSTLTGFTFVNQGFGDTIDLLNASGSVLDSVSTPASTPSDSVSVDWDLTAGTQYYLVQTTYGNGSWMYNNGNGLPSDSQISFTDTGVFSNGSLSSANFGVTGDFYYDDFNNITTASAATPEPATALLILPAAAAALWQARRRKATN